MPKGDWPAGTLEPKQVRRLIMATNPRARSGLRDRALMTMLYRAGLRSNEARSVEVSDLIYSPASAVRVREVKGRKRGAKARTQALDPQAWAIVMQWLAMRGDHAGFLFDTASGGKIDINDLVQMVARRARRANIPQRVTPHTLRHTMAYELRREGYDVVHIQKTLGHSNLATTAVYLQHFGDLEVMAENAERRW